MKHNATKVDKAELSETKRKLLDASVQLMRSKGFNATTVDDICANAGVTKGGFFHYFDSKQDIAKAAMERFRETRRQTFAAAPFNQLADPLDRILGRLKFVQEELKKSLPVTGGCLIGMFAQEVAVSNPELRQACHDSLDRLAQDLEKDFAAAKAQYGSIVDFEPHRMATLFISIYQGSILIAKAAGNHAVIEDNFTQYTQLLTGIFGRPASTFAKDSATSSETPLANPASN